MNSSQLWNVDIRLTDPQQEEDLKSFIDQKELVTALPIVPPPFEVEMTSDASDLGWGVTFGWDGVEISGSFTDEVVQEHINIKEFLAVLWGLENYTPLLKGKVIRWHIDNQVVLAILR